MQSERSTDAFRTLEARALDPKDRSARERDTLTGLHSWAWFEQQLTEWFGEARHGKTQLTVILADIDGLEAINQIRGRDAGDEAISAVGACLRRRLRPRDLVARHSGAVFAVLLTRAPSNAARVVAERLRASVAADTAPRVTVSIGCVTLERGGFASWDQVLDAASRALEAAKRDGRDRVVALSDGTSAAGIIDAGVHGAVHGAVHAAVIDDPVGDPLDRPPHAV